MILTKIEVQKKNKKRYSLYSEDVFLFGVSEDTLIHFNLQKDLDYSENKLQEILKYEDVMLCLSQAYRYLSRRPHLESELKRKLWHKEFDNITFDYLESILLFNQEFIEFQRPRKKSRSSSINSQRNRGSSLTLPAPTPYNQYYKNNFGISKSWSQIYR